MKIKALNLILTILLSVYAYPSILFAQSSSPDTAQQTIGSQKKIVKSIEVKGNKSIGISTILAKIKTRVGQEYLENVISDDLKRLYNTGYFSDVSVDRENYEGGFKVIIYLVEKPIIEEVTFSRTRYLNSRTLQRKMKIQKGRFLDNKLLRDDIRTIEELYAKKGLTRAQVDFEKSVDEVTNKVKLHFIIKEGMRLKIKKINVYGNKSFGQKQIIRVIKTRADSLFTSGYVKDDLLDEDMERINSFYEQKGFIDAQADYSLTEWMEGRLALDITINEGKQYFVESVTYSGNKVLEDFELEAVMAEIKSGNAFSRDKLSVDVSNIRARYFDEGYIFARVQESTSLNPDTGKVEVLLDIEEGDLAYVNKIEIQGNTRTRDIVIRRELRLDPGDQFDGAKLKRSKERLRNLGFFEDISYDIADTNNPTLKDLVVQVKEAKTGSFSFGGGFSTVDRVVGFIEVEQRNFDFTNWPTFTGGGQTLRIRGESGSTRNNVLLSFTEPWIFDYPISGGFDVYRRERDRERDIGYAYDELRTGGDIRLGKSFTEYVGASLIYRLEEVEISDIQDDVSDDLKAERGKNTVSLLGLSVSRDYRDSTISPTSGLLLVGNVDTAGGFLGGDKDFFRVIGTASYYIPFKFDSVVNFRLKAGVVDAYGDSDRVPIFERFFAGGARTIRGYDERKVGPIDSRTDDPLGGEALLVGNIEYTIPLIDFLKLAAFYDVGGVWAKVEDFGKDEFKSGMGLGLRVKTPIGPVNLDYGYPLNDEPGEEGRSGKFYFSVSRGF